MKAFAILTALALMLVGTRETSAQVEMEWSRTYGGGRDDFCYSIVQTADGGFALAGGTDSFSADQVGEIAPSYRPRDPSQNAALSHGT